MSDKLRNTLQNIPEFSLGEQPDPLKLNQSFRVVQQALNQLEETIGDVTIKSSDNTTLSDRPLTIASLGRFLGPTQSISPPLPIDQQFEFQGTLNLGTNAWTVPAWAHDGVSESITVNTNNATDYNGSSLFQTKRAMTYELTVPGDWKFDTNTNQIISFAPLAGGAATCVGTSLLNRTILQGGLGEYWYPGNSVPNVQPPFEITTPTSIEIKADTSGGSYTHIIEMDPETYTISSPIHGTNASRLNEAGLQSAASKESSDYGINPFLTINTTVAQRLPYELDPLLTTDDEIPRPFVTLYNETNDTLYETSRYFYRDSTSFFFKGPTLNAGHNYRVITSGGIDISSSLEGLQFSLKHHKHSGPHAISHEDLLRTGYSPEPSTMPAAISSNKFYGWHRPTVPSITPGNPHPQYLMRNGYDFEYDDANSRNTMMGPITMAQIGTNASLQDINDLLCQTDLESWEINFGCISEIRLGKFGNYNGGTPNATNVGLLVNGRESNRLLLAADYRSTDTDAANQTFWMNGTYNVGLAAGSNYRVESTGSNNFISNIGSTNRVDSKLRNSQLNIIGASNIVSTDNAPTVDTTLNSFINHVGISSTCILDDNDQVYCQSVGNGIQYTINESTNSMFNFVGSGFDSTANQINNSIINVAWGTTAGGSVVLPGVIPDNSYYTHAEYVTEVAYCITEDADCREEIRPLRISDWLVESTGGTPVIIETNEFQRDAISLTLKKTEVTNAVYELNMPGDSRLKEISLYLAHDDIEIRVYGREFDGTKTQIKLVTDTGVAPSFKTVTIDMTADQLLLGTNSIKGNRFTSRLYTDFILEIRNTIATPANHTIIQGGTITIYRDRI